LPPPEPIDPQNDPTEIEEDWMGLFAGYSDRASSERLRKLWGRILAGEIRKPGSFALSTLRVISEMDAEIALIFQEVVSLRISASHLLKPKVIRNEILRKWTFLEEVGLIQGVDGNLSYTYSGNPREFRTTFTNNYGLRIHFTEKKKSAAVSVVAITRAGRQIAEILPWDEVAALRAVADRMIDQVGGLELCRVIERGPDTTRLIVTEVIKALEVA
jgi:hypothetical protein